VTRSGVAQGQCGISLDGFIAGALVRADPSSAGRRAQPRRHVSLGDIGGAVGVGSRAAHGRNLAVLSADTGPSAWAAGRVDELLLFALPVARHTPSSFGAA
jgi:hypothetical protein